MNTNDKIWIDLSNINKNNTQYDWRNSIGKSCKFKYYDLEGVLNIIDCNYNEKNVCMLTIQYLDKEPHIIASQNFRAGKLSRYLKDYTPYEYKYNIGDVLVDDNRNLTITGRELKIRQCIINGENKERRDGWYSYHCNICGADTSTLSYLIETGTGCSCCSNRTVVPGINDIPTTDPWMIPYFQGGENEAKLYTSQSGKKIYPKCPDCGEIKDKEIIIGEIYRCHSIGCKCSDGKSYPNKFSYAFLRQLPIHNWKTEYNPDWLKPYLFDNYFEYNDNKYVLEMDGQFHYSDNNKYKISHKEVREKDIIKDNLAKKYNINVIRIDCKKSDMNYIKNNILNSKLNEIFDLSNIDWIECEKYAYKNIVKEVCSFYENNGYPQYKDMVSIFNLHESTIGRYIRKGIKCGWCKSKDEIKLEKIKNMCTYYMENNYPSKHKLSKLFHFTTTNINKHLKYGESQGWCKIHTENIGASNDALFY